jgi:hypothetical protein
MTSLLGILFDEDDICLGGCVGCGNEVENKTLNTFQVPTRHPHLQMITYLQM